MRFSVIPTSELHSNDDLDTPHVVVNGTPLEVCAVTPVYVTEQTQDLLSDGEFTLMSSTVTYRDVTTRFSSLAVTDTHHIPCHVLSVRTPNGLREVMALPETMATVWTR